MNDKNIFYFIGLMLCFNFGNGQQDPMFSLYTIDKAIINPGYTGSSNWAVGTIKYRQQFVGLDGNPSTQTINFHSPIQKKHIGIGFKIIKDKVGITNNINAALMLSYHLNFAGGKLSVGIDGGMYSRKIDYTKLVLSSKGDNAMPETAQSALVPDFSWGLYYQRKQLYCGLSQYHLLKSNFAYGTADSKSHLYNHIYFILGKVYDINKKWSLDPSILVKYQPAAPIQLDINATLFYDEKLGTGIQYRTGDAIMCVLKYNITENLRIAYAYDLTVSRLRYFSNGSHEIVLSYGIKLPPPPSQKIIHPRFYF